MFKYLTGLEDYSSLTNSMLRTKYVVLNLVLSCISLVCGIIIGKKPVTASLGTLKSIICSKV